MANILILIGGHLCTAPRPQKEAEALAKVGHNVTVRGVWFEPLLAEQDLNVISQKKYSFEPIVDIRQGSLSNIRERIESRMARELFQRVGFFSAPLLGYGARVMLKVALKTRADLTIVHSELGLWVGARLLNAGYKVGVDFEDWFSEDWSQAARKQRPTSHSKTLESRLARDCRYCLTTSSALAGAMSEAYHVSRPLAVYNVFPFSERMGIDNKLKDRMSNAIPSIHWFSQTIGPGRGLEVLMKALPLTSVPFEVHIRGNYPDSAKRLLESQMPFEWRNRVFIHKTVSNDELLSRIAEHDIGLALEQTEIPSRNLSVTNKFFQYMQAGLAIIATETAGQREVFSQNPQIGRLIPPNDPVALAEALNDLLSSPERLASAKREALRASEEKFCWEKQENVLLDAADLALSESRYRTVPAS